METATADPLVGHVLEGRYRIQQRLARGGMSTVYAAMDERLDRQVAVKVMAASLSGDPAFVDRFSREARAAAKLSHVNAVSVYDQGSDAGKVFLVMELVRGRTLRDLLHERDHLSPAEAVSVMEPVLAALAAAHRAGLVHRDVKPENILLADDGVVKVAEFGLARAVVADASSTRTGLMMGTVAYSSPEQFRNGDVDTRSDVYSAGIVLFELLTGRTPFEGGDAMAVAYQHVHSDVPRPSSLRRGLTGPLDDLVTEATSRDPSGRPADAGALLAALHDVRRALRLPVLPVPRRPRGPQRNSPPVQSPGGRPATPAPAGRDAAGRTQQIDRAGEQRATAPQQRGTSDVHHTMVAPTVPPAGSARLPTVNNPSRPAKPRRRRRWVRTLVGAVVLLLVCAAIGFGSWWFASGRYRAVPDVQDRSTSAASKILRSHGFKVATDDPVLSDTVTKGMVVRTDPGTGVRVHRGGTVHLVPSGGPHLFVVPDVRNKTRALAQDALADLVAARVKVEYPPLADDTVPAGSVIRTDPVAGVSVRSGTTVSVYVSTGPPILTVPDETGKAQNDASDALTALGFKVSVTLEFSDTAPTGQVIRQTPKGTSKLRKFKTVGLVVSKGQDLVEIPVIPRLDPVAEARTQLEALGFKVAVSKSFGGESGLVVGVDPAPGKKIKRGSTVTLYVI
ncbi:MAG: Stk1 family PASTA domain-containing Ser/Thr kinase [Jatrophihabitans sp.]